MDAFKEYMGQGVAFVFACAMLKILFDAVYKKIPRGFRRLRNEVRHQTALLLSKHDEAMAMLKAQATAQQAVHKDIAALVLATNKQQGRGSRSSRGKNKPPGRAGAAD